MSYDVEDGPSQIDYNLASRRWSTSAHKTRVKWGVSCQRCGRHYDHGMVTCDWQCRVTSQRQQERQIDYSTLERDELTQDRFNASVAQHFDDSPCDLDNAATSLTRLTKCVTDAKRETLPARCSHPLRKREVSQHTMRLYKEQQRAYSKMGDRHRGESSRAIAVSSRDDFEMAAESMGNVHEVSKLTGHKERRGIQGH